MTNVIARIDADLADAADVAAIDHLLERDARAFARPPREHLESALERLDEAAIDDQRIVLAARHQGAIVGLIDTRLHHPEPGALTIAAIAVDPSMRRRGLGRQLIDAVMAEARAQEDGEVPTLVAGVHTENAAARAFFYAEGFATKDESARVVVLTKRPPETTVEPAAAKTTPSGRPITTLRRAPWSP